MDAESLGERRRVVGVHLFDERLRQPQESRPSLVRFGHSMYLPPAILTLASAWAAERPS